MYERYTEPARYAVFYANWEARLAETLTIDSIHFLKALMYKEDFRSNSLFRLREHFPLHRSCPSKFGTIEEVPQTTPALADHAKRILAHTASEADAIRDYWIDTEHIILGILAERDCVAAQYLLRTGLMLRDARRRVVENKASRPDYGPVPTLWAQQSPLDRWLSKLRAARGRF